MFEHREKKVVSGTIIIEKPCKLIYTANFARLPYPNYGQGSGSVRVFVRFFVYRKHTPNYRQRFLVRPSPRSSCGECIAKLYNFCFIIMADPWRKQPRTIGRSRSFCVQKYFRSPAFRRGQRILSFFFFLLRQTSLYGSSLRAT